MISTKDVENQTISENIRWLREQDRFGIKMGLSRIEQICHLWKNPQHAVPTIHIAGTNGKGSTAIMIESILRRAGLKTGLYTSPHLYSVTERIRYNGRPISNSQLSLYLNELKKLCEKHGVAPTYTESLTALGFRYLADKHADIAVIETGMGGMLDATNVITPLVSVITNIGLDHTEYLGSTKQAIALRKSGVIKPRVPLVTSDRDPKITAFLKHMCAVKNAPYRHSRDVCKVTPLTQTWSKQTVHIRTKSLSTPLSLSLIGVHQRQNLTTALAVVEQLTDSGYTITESDVIKGLAEVRWPGRMQLAQKQPFVLVDGAHNSDALDYLASSISALPRHDTLIVALKKSKSPAVLNTIAKPFKRIYAVEGVYDPMPANELADELKKKWPKKTIAAIADAAAATKLALKTAGSNDVIVVTGSLYMIPQALKALKQEPSSLKDSESGHAKIQPCLL